jgi:hypothetical protein
MPPSGTTKHEREKARISNIEFSISKFQVLLLVCVGHFGGHPDEIYKTRFHRAGSPPY